LVTRGGARRGGVALLVVLAVLAAAALGGRALWHAAQSAVKSDGCDFGSYRLNLSRSQNAASMVSVVISRKLPERAAVLVLGAALQESKLDNIPDGQGDRDSVGILQQRPSQGWGDAANLSDIRYATGKFLDALVKVPNWQSDSLAVVVQKVQISADGSAYAKHEAQAKQMSDALMGVTAAGVKCDYALPAKVAAASSVSSGLSKELPVNTPTASGTTLSVPRAGWPTAAWLVAHGSMYGIEKVSYSGKVWQRNKGWKDDATAGSGAVSAILGS
jgi:hypothetical protein